MATKQSGQGQSSSSFPLDDLTYDLVTVLYEKSVRDCRLSEQRLKTAHCPSIRESSDGGSPYDGGGD